MTAWHEMGDEIEFLPHPWLRGGHRQTLAGAFWASRILLEPADRMVVTLADDDQIVLHGNVPAHGSPGNPLAILLHGLCGCHASPYMERIAAKLVRCGIQTVRMDQRGWGAGEQCARHGMHAGRSEDLRAAFEHCLARFPGSPVVLVGFSLGANVALKLAAEYDRAPPESLRGVLAISPPMDLAACAKRLQQGWGRWYERYFLRQLLPYVRRQSLRSSRWAARLADAPKISTLRDFDHHFTAPLAGFASAADYYEQCSTLRRLDAICVPTWILLAQDDPMVPSLTDSDRPTNSRIELCQPRYGGHLGFVARRSGPFDGRWMDWRVVTWVQQALADGPSRAKVIA